MRTADGSRVAGVSSDSLPVIDIRSLVANADEAAMRATAESIDDACRRTGFFYVVGHGVDPGLRSDLDRLAREFFAQSDEAKAEIAMAGAGRAWRGWFPVGGELTSGRPDQKEGIYFGSELPADDPRVIAGRPLHGANLFPSRPASLQEVVLDYLEAMTAVGHAVARGLGLALGLGAEWFERNLTADPLVLFRIFHYPAGVPEEAWGVGEHTDYGLLTLLGQDDHGGLEVRGPDDWIDAPPLAESFVCNLGDMLERMTQGRYRSTPHRARNRGAVGRLSFPFFFDPGWDVVVPHLPLGAGERTEPNVRWDGASPLEFSGTYGDYVTAKVSKVFPDLHRASVEPQA